MNDELDIKEFTKLQKLISTFQKVNQLSWASDQAKKRYPATEAMTFEEMKTLIKFYIVLGLEIELIYDEWMKIKNEEK